MKKAAVLLVIILTLMIFAVPVFGEGISVTSKAGNNIKIMEDINIDNPLDGNAIVVLGNITVNNRVNGHVITIFGDASINAEVSGQVVTLFGNTDILASSVIMEDVITVGSIRKSAGASILGNEVRILGDSMNLDIGAIAYFQLTVMILFTAATLIVGLLALLISRTAYRNISSNLDKRIGRKLILGILAFLGLSALLLLLLITLIAPILYIVALIMATITASMFFGKHILKTFSQKNSTYMEFITGLISITLVKLLIIFLVPQRSILLGFALVGVLDMIIYSVGLGIYMEHHYIKVNEGKS
jgi:hypothetical protein